MNLIEKYTGKIETLEFELDAEALLKSVRIDLSREIKPPPPVIQIDNKDAKPVTIFTEGNISVIQGKAKARKSFAVAMFTAAAISNQTIYRRIIGVPKKLVVYFDTEQSSFYVQQSVDRINRISHGDGFDTRFYAFALRKYDPAQRLFLIDWVFKNFKNLGFVVIDGIRDLIRDINSPEEATMITSKLLQWTETTGAHVLTVLHENKADGKARGHIGSELVNKAETVLRVEKLDSDKKYSRISCEMLRGLEFDPLYFVIDDNLPQVVVNPPSEVLIDFE
jgi:hypothetical protein